MFCRSYTVYPTSQPGQRLARWAANICSRSAARPWLTGLAHMNMELQQASSSKGHHALIALFSAHGLTRTSTWTGSCERSRRAGSRAAGCRIPGNSPVDRRRMTRWRTRPLSIAYRLAALDVVLLAWPRADSSHSTVHTEPSRSLQFSLTCYTSNLWVRDLIWG